MGILRTSKIMPLSTTFLTPTQAPLLLDSYPNAAFAYSLRKLRTAYGGSAIRIRRSSDNAEQDFGFDGSGNFDSTGAAAFIGGGSGYITTWYDQSGNGINVEQVTAANQPTYVASGINSIPTVSFSNASATAFYYGSVAQTVLGSGTSCSSFAVIRPSSLLQIGPIWAWGPGGGSEYCTMSNHDHGDGSPAHEIAFDYPQWFNAGELVVAEPGGWDAAEHILECNRDEADLFEIIADGVSIASATLTNQPIPATSSYLGIGGNLNSRYFDSYISEVIHWGSDVGSSARTAIRTNMNAYYTVF